MTGRNGFRVLLTILALIITAGCSGPGADRGGTSLDLLTLSPRESRLAGDLPPLPGARSWSFAGGLPSGWQAGPEGVRVSLGNGGVLLEHPDQPPWLELAAVVDPRLHNEVWADLQPLSGQVAECFFSSSNPGSYRVSCRTSAAFGEPGGEIRRVGFHLPPPQNLEGPIRVLRLYPGSVKGSAVVHRAGLEPLAEEAIPPRFYSRDRLDLLREFRRCWRLAGAGERSAAFRVPGPDAEICFAVGTLIGGGSGTLCLTLEAGGEAREILRVPFPTEGEGWAEHRAAIGRWAGHEVLLRFRVDPAGPPSIRLIGSPRVLAPAADRAHRTDSRHLLLIVVDSLRADRLSHHGHHRRTSPHLARLARQGDLYTSARSGASWGLPAVASLFTGCEPAGLGVTRGRPPHLPASRVTLAERLALEGWNTAAFVANPDMPQDRDLLKGFDTWYGAPAGHRQLRAGRLVQRALRWLSEQGDGRTFCYLQLHDPASPYAAPAPEGREADPAAGYRLGEEGRWQDGNIRPLVAGRQRLTGTGDRDHLRRLYDEEVAYTDRCIGLLLASLEAGGMLSRTTVVVTAGHGEELGDRGFWGNGHSLHRELTRVPLMIRKPGQHDGAGTVCSEPVSLADLMPTMLKLAGVDSLPEGIDGRVLPPPKIFNTTR